ncbi:muscarinic acetylcholine receptor M5-like [Lineus longissimus]|uniref:muscarinic acetylcholine receptor M5-like n=1 Tax=Lineus longissimus TaxID=88925 RepID=UPI00315D38B2
MAHQTRKDVNIVEDLDTNRIYETVSQGISASPHVVPHIGANVTAPSHIHCRNDTSASAIISMMNEEQNSVLLPTIIFLGIVGSLGAFGNLLVLYIFRFRRKSRSSASFFVCILACVEVIICCVDVPMQIIRMIEYFEEMPYSTVMCKVSRWILFSSVSVTCMFVTIMAYDRYVAICKPLQWRTKTSNKIKIVMATAFVVGTAGQGLQFTFGQHAAVPLKAAVMQWSYIELEGINKSAITFTSNVCVCELFFEFHNHLYLAYILGNLVIFLSCVMLSTVFYTKIFREMSRRKKFWRLAEAASNISGSTSSLFAENNRRRTSSPNISIGRHRTHSVDFIDRSYKTAETEVTGTSYAKVDELETPKRKNAVYMDPKKLEELTQINENEELFADGEKARSFSVSKPPGTSKWDEIKKNIDRQRRASVSVYAESLEVARRSSEIVPPVVRHKQRTESVGSISIVSTDSSRRNSRESSMASARRTSVSTIIHKQNFIMAEVFLCVTVILFLSWTPYWILKICSILIQEFIQSRSKYAATVLFFFQNLYYINYVVNPIVYFVLNTQFREDVKVIFLCRKESKVIASGAESKMANIL